MVVRLMKKWSVLPAACVGLAWIATGCGESANESGSSGATTGAAGAPAADAAPPPKSLKDWAEKQHPPNSAPSGKAAPRAKKGA